MKSLEELDNQSAISLAQKRTLEELDTPPAIDLGWSSPSSDVKDIFTTPSSPVDETIGGVFDNIKDYIPSGENLKEAFKGVTDFIPSTLDRLSSAKSGMDVAQVGVDTVKGLADLPLSAVGLSTDKLNIFEHPLDTAKNILNAPTQAVDNWTNAPWTTAMGATALLGMPETVKGMGEGVGNLTDKVKDVSKEHIDFLKNAFADKTYTPEEIDKQVRDMVASGDAKIAPVEGSKPLEEGVVRKMVNEVKDEPGAVEALKEAVKNSEEFKGKKVEDITPESTVGEVEDIIKKEEEGSQSLTPPSSEDVVAELAMPTEEASKENIPSDVTVSLKDTETGLEEPINKQDSSINDIISSAITGKEYVPIPTNLEFAGHAGIEDATLKQKAEDIAKVVEINDPTVNPQTRLKQLNIELNDLRNQKSSLSKYDNKFPDVVKGITEKEKEISDFENGIYKKVEDISLSKLVDPEREPVLIRPGPGAKNAQEGITIKETPSDMAELAKIVKDAVGDGSAEARQRQAAKLAEVYGKGKDAISQRLDALKTTYLSIVDAIKNGESATIRVYKNLLGDYLYNRQYSGLKVKEFSKEMVDSIAKDRREAMAKWYVAGGDEVLLNEWASKIDDPRLKKMYKDALSLTESEKHIAQNILSYHESKLFDALSSGVMESGVENYLRRVWDLESQDKSIFKNFISEINSGLLNTNPKLLQRRILETEFQGEMLGLSLKSYDIAERTAAYDLEFNEMMAARAFVKGGFEALAKDGRPLFVTSGYGKVLEKADGVDPTYLINPKVKPTTRYLNKKREEPLTSPKVKPKDVGDYRVVDHPALRKWKFAASDGKGGVILVKGDALVHPEVYKHVKNLLTKSAIQTAKPGLTLRYSAKLALRLSTEFKSTLFSLSGFHQVQTGTHAVFHMSNPFDAPEINLDARSVIGGIDGQHQAMLVKNGLVAYSENALAMYGDGLQSTGLVNRLPVIGKFAMDYGNYLFNDYIPRQKMQLALSVFERNLERYKATKSLPEIYELTANQANAAFGELNVEWLGRNKTTQDVFRLVALAPDFLEARARFVGQALKAGGREQAIALLRGTAMLYLTSKALNLAINGKEDSHWNDWAHPFSVFIGKREYTIRSIPGDLIHLATAPANFVVNRLNPIAVKVPIETVYQRDQYGRKQTPGQLGLKLVKSATPISVGTVFKSHDKGFDWVQSAIDGALSVGGVSVYEPKQKQTEGFTDSQMKKGNLEKMISPETFKLKEKTQTGERKSLKDLDEGEIGKLKQRIGNSRMPLEKKQMLLEKLDYRR